MASPKTRHKEIARSEKRGATSESVSDIRETVRTAYGGLYRKEEACCDSQSTCCDDQATKSSEAPSHPWQDALMKELSPQEGMRVLDVGCGTGDTVLKIAKRVGPTGKAVGIDFSPEAITKAEMKAQGSGLEDVVEFRLADAENLPFEEGSFDAVISECVLSLVPEKSKALKEKVRVLKSGGKVVMHDVIAWSPMPKAIREDPKLYCACIGGAVTLEDYTDMMREAGLVGIRTVDHTERARRLNAYALLVALDITNEDDLHEIVDFFQKGGIGYALFMGRKPQELEITE